MIGELLPYVKTKKTFKANNKNTKAAMGKTQ